MLLHTCGLWLYIFDVVCPLPIYYTHWFNKMHSVALLWWPPCAASLERSQFLSLLLFSSWYQSTFLILVPMGLWEPLGDCESRTRAWVRSLTLRAWHNLNTVRGEEGRNSHCVLSEPGHSLDRSTSIRTPAFYQSVEVHYCMEVLRSLWGHHPQLQSFGSRSLPSYQALNRVRSRTIRRLKEKKKKHVGSNGENRGCIKGTPIAALGREETSIDAWRFFIGT